MESDHSGWAERLRSAEAAALAGLVFGVVFIAAVGLLSGQPAPDAADAEIVDWLEDGGTDDAMALAQFMCLTAIIAFLWFIGVFRRRVGDRVDQFTSSVFLGSGLVLAALMAVGVSLLTAPTILYGPDRPVATVDVYAALNSVGRSVLLIYANGLAGVFTLSSSTMVKKSGVFPAWLSVVGYLVAVSLILSPFDILEELVVFPAWVMLVSLVVLIRRRQLPDQQTPVT